MLSKKELFNARSSSEELTEGLVIEVKAVGTYPDKDKDGNDVNVSVIVDKEGTVYAGISSTVAESIPMLDELIAEADENGESVSVEVIQKTSKNGRKFTQLKAL